MNKKGKRIKQRHIHQNSIKENRPVETKHRTIQDTTNKSPLLTSSRIFSTFSFSCKCMYNKAPIQMKQVTTMKNPNTDMHVEQHETRPLVLDKIKKLLTVDFFQIRSFVIQN